MKITGLAFFPRLACSIVPDVPEGGGGKARGKQLIEKYASKRPERPKTISKILVVDDQSVILRAINRLCQKLGFEVDSLNPVEQEKKIGQLASFAISGQFDMVILDGNMIVTQGYIVAKQLRAAGYSGYIVSNTSDANQNNLLLEAGADFAINNKDYYLLKNYFQP
jgi:CheY-like chemotaxis protein